MTTSGGRARPTPPPDGAAAGAACWTDASCAACARSLLRSDDLDLAAGKCRLVRGVALAVVGVAVGDDLLNEAGGPAELLLTLRERDELRIPARRLGRRPRMRGDHGPGDEEHERRRSERVEAAVVASHLRLRPHCRRRRGRSLRTRARPRLGACGSRSARAGRRRPAGWPAGPVPIRQRRQLLRQQFVIERPRLVEVDAKALFERQVRGVSIIRIQRQNGRFDQAAMCRANSVLPEPERDRRPRSDRVASNIVYTRSYPGKYLNSILPLHCGASWAARRHAFRYRLHRRHASDLRHHRANDYVPKQNDGQIVNHLRLTQQAVKPRAGGPLAPRIVRASNRFD